MGESAVSGNLTGEVEYETCSLLEALYQCPHQPVLLNESVYLALSRPSQVLLQHNQNQEPGNTRNVEKIEYISCAFQYNM